MTAKNWIFDERELSLANPQVDAELRLDDAVREEAPAEQLSPVAAWFRFGTTMAELIIERKQVIQSAHYGGAFKVMWWSINYGATQLAGMGRTHGGIAPAQFEQFDRYLAEALQIFVREMPSNGAGNLVHLTGAYVDGTWRPNFFRSFGYADWYPFSQQRVIALRAERDHRTLLPANNSWRFDERRGPTLVLAPSGESLTYAGGDEPSLEKRETGHRFRYDGPAGSVTLPVKFKLIAIVTDTTKPLSWQVDYHDPSRRSGSPGDRSHPPEPGEASLPETQWRQLDRFVIEALLRWPACRATGPGPVWISSKGAYHDGLWCGFLPRAAGPNNETTGLTSSM